MNSIQFDQIWKIGIGIQIHSIWDSNFGRRLYSFYLVSFFSFFIFYSVLSYLIIFYSFIFFFFLFYFFIFSFFFLHFILVYKFDLELFEFKWNCGWFFCFSLFQICLKLVTIVIRIHPNFTNSKIFFFPNVDNRFDLHIRYPPRNSPQVP